MRLNRHIGWTVTVVLAAMLPVGIAYSDVPPAQLHPKPQGKPSLKRDPAVLFKHSTTSPLLSNSQSSSAAKAQPAEPVIHQLMVKLRQPAAMEKVAALGHARMTALSTTAGVQLRAVRAMSGATSVVALEKPVRLSEAKVIAARLAADPAVESAEPDMPVKRAQQVTPPDSSFTGRQWNLQTPGTTFNSVPAAGGGATVPFTNGGGANFQNAWTIHQGQNAIRVAVIDTGVITTHPDLTNALIPGSGYDFVSEQITGFPDNFVANDGDGRDADPSDPGDWVTAQDKDDYAQCDDDRAGDTPSSWHGTHMAGLVAAQWGGAVAGTSLAGAAPDVRIVPVRVLGKCGGVSSDVIDAMRWAAGLAVTGVPANAYPAQVLSLSLGGGGCSTLYQQAVNEILNANVVIVAATGNDGMLAVTAPAGCNGVIAVTAHIVNGENADYSNVGSATAISAPGGGDFGTLLDVTNLTRGDSATYIWSTGMDGATTPTGPSIMGVMGTSPATPQVAATVALMKSITLGLTPAQVRAYLQASAQPHPAGGYCQLALNACGAGLLDAHRALHMVSVSAPIPNAGPDQRAVAGATVTLSGSAQALGGKTVLANGYAWSVESGSAVSFTNPNDPNTTFTAPSSGTVVLRLTATDNASVTGYDLVMVRVNSVPTLSGQSTAGTEGKPLSITFQGSDADFDSLTYAVAPGSSLPSGATLLGNGSFDWINPVAGTHTFAVVASDGLSDSAPAAVTLIINAQSNGGGGGGGGAVWPGALLGLLVLAWCRGRWTRPSKHHA